MSITIKSGAKAFYQWERGMYLTVSSPCDILRLWRHDDRASVELTPSWSGSTGTVSIPDRMLTESGYLYAERVERSEQEERVLERVRLVVRAAQKPGNDASATKEVEVWETLQLQMAALERAAREGKFDGKDGITPHIGANGNWFVGDVDLGIRAQGEKGDKGEKGDTPYIGANGNWYIGDVDTGVSAKLAADAAEKAEEAWSKASAAQSMAQTASQNAQTAVEAAGNAESMAGSAEAASAEAKSDAASAKSSAAQAESMAYQARTTANAANTTAAEAKQDVVNHNLSVLAHSDIRLLISSLTDRMNAIANSTDEDLDQMAEIVAYIKSNKSMIDSITTSKVSVSDIIDNLTTNVSDMPLSAAMGVELKRLIDAIGAGDDAKNVWYGVSGGAEEQYLTKRTVTTDTGDFELKSGNVVYVKMMSRSEYNVYTINVDDTGDIAAYAYSDRYIVGRMWGKGEIVGFVYDGSVYRMIDGMFGDDAIYGMVRLTDNINEKGSGFAAKPKAVREAYDLAETANTESVKTVAQELTDEQKAQVLTNLGQSTEVWSFEMEDGTTVEKRVVLA